MMLLLKMAPLSVRSLASTPKIKTHPCHRNLATVFAVWSGVMNAITCFMKWLQKTQTFTMFGGWSNSIVVSMLLKSTWSSSREAVTKMVCSGPLAQAPLCWIHLLHLLIALRIHIAMPGHQNQSYSRDSVHCRPWCSTSLWHSFMATTQWAIGTMNCITSSSSLASVWWW